MKNPNLVIKIIAVFSGIFVILSGIVLIAWEETPGTTVVGIMFCVLGVVLLFFPWIVNWWKDMYYYYTITTVTDGFRPESQILDFQHSTLKIDKRIRKYNQVVNAEFPDGSKTTVRACWKNFELVLVTKDNKYLFTGIDAPWKKK